MYSGGSGLSIDIHFVDIELSYDVLSPLPTLLSKHFNHPHPYIEIATAISDTDDLKSLQFGNQGDSHEFYVALIDNIKSHVAPRYSTTHTSPNIISYE